MIAFLSVLVFVLLGLSIWLAYQWRQEHNQNRQLRSRYNKTLEAGQPEISHTTLNIPEDFLLLTSPPDKSKITHFHEDLGDHHFPVKSEFLQLLKDRLEDALNIWRDQIPIIFHSRIKNQELICKIQFPISDRSSLFASDRSTEAIQYIEKIEGNYFTTTMSSRIMHPGINPTKIEPTKNYKDPVSSDIIIEKDDQLILIVEDNPSVGDFIKSCIPHEFKTLLAYNGKTGSELALRHIPDIIITDIMMPEMDGKELCRLLKTDIRTDHIPIIMLTAKARDRDRLEGLKYGADAYLTKPFSEEELRLRIVNFFTLSQRIKRDHSKNNLPHLSSQFTEKLQKILAENYQDESFGVQELCKGLAMSRMQVHRKMKSIMNVSTSEAIKNYRLDKSTSLLKHNNASISEVAFEVGFSDPAYFSKLFRQRHHMTPSQYREQFQ